MTEPRRALVRRGLAAVTLLLAASCTGESTPDAAPSSSSSAAPTTASTVAPTTATTVDRATTPAASTSTTSTTSTTEPQETTSTTTAPFPTTTVHTVPDDCDVAATLAVVDDAVALARLEPATVWVTEGATTFDARTNDAEEFRDRLALDCRVRAVQRTEAGDRLLLAAWTGDRRAFVVQDSGGPPTPYRADQRLQLLYEQPLGEWLVDQEIWAGTLTEGETVVVGVDDSSLGATAKAWQALPRWEDIPVSIETERYAIDVLLHAGARNVSPGEPASPGSTVAAIQFVTPLGLPLIATVAPVGDFDHTAPIVEGDRTVETIDGVDVLVTRGGPDSYAVAAAGWECGDHVWFVDAVWGTVDELVDWVAAVVRAAGCGTSGS